MSFLNHIFFLSPESFVFSAGKKTVESENKYAEQFNQIGIEITWMLFLLKLPKI